MGFLGFLLILVSIGLFITTKVVNLRSVDEVVDSKYGKERLKAHPSFLVNYSLSKTIYGVLIGISLILVKGMFFINDAGTATAIQYLWGGDNAVTSQGIKMKLWGKTIPISFEIAMQDYIP